MASIRDNVLIWGDGSWSGVRVDDQRAVDLLSRACEEHKPDIIFLEPFRSIWHGEENDSTAMSTGLDVLKSVASLHDCAVMLTHHERKSGAGEDGDEMSASRGSTALEGVCAVMERWTPVQGGAQSELKWTKNRYGRKPAPVRVTFSYDSWGYTYVPEEALARQILQLMQDAPTEWHYVDVVAEELNETPRNVREAMNGMKDAGELKRGKSSPREGGGSTGYRYRLPVSGAADDGRLDLT